MKNTKWPGIFQHLKEAVQSWVSEMVPFKKFDSGKSRNYNLNRIPSEYEQKYARGKRTQPQCHQNMRSLI